MRTKDYVLQFTGGRDSTLVANILASREDCKAIHFLTFKTDLMTELEKVNTNINKLRSIYPEVIMYSYIIDTNDLLKELFNDHYFSKLLKFRSFYLSTFCPCCRLSHHIHTIIYCLYHNVDNIADGINKLTGFDLFQQPWIVKRVKKLYEEYKINYETPLLNTTVSSEVLLDKFNERGNKEVLFECQPKCNGGGQFHNVYLRAYYLPRKGKRQYIIDSTKWYNYSLKRAKHHIDKHLKGCIK